MKKEIDLNPSNENIHIIESFIEDVCDYHNISDKYYANIIMAITEATKVIYRNKPDKFINITFEYSQTGLNFEIISELDWNSLIVNENIEMELDSEEDREIFMIWSMPDRVTISDDGKKLKMSFTIENIDNSIADSRNQTMKFYYDEQKKKIKS